MWSVSLSLANAESLMYFLKASHLFGHSINAVNTAHPPAVQQDSDDFYSEIHGSPLNYQSNCEYSGQHMQMSFSSGSLTQLPIGFQTSSFSSFSIFFIWSPEEPSGITTNLLPLYEHITSILKKTTIAKFILVSLRKE